ncbi:bifunctional diguanylate cyclase/phosphodiesterase [Nocardia sp. BMG111209]|uniref:putative bifunctional diguanylate cyclase/phosphodiesterase n=1 Tax=Nocardia sp. BMG111209 TaxID=1160137 RepID=UPI00038160D5|nr:EAL domain-containing protein [Nocardia sp. BMG111209]
MAKKPLKPPSVPLGARHSFFAYMQRLVIENGDMSTPQLGRLLDYSHQAVYKALTGPRMPSHSMAAGLARVLAGEPAAAVALRLWSAGVQEEQRVIRERVAARGKPVGYGANIGVAVSASSDNTFTDGPHRTDHALLAAKSRRGSRVVVSNDVVRPDFEPDDLRRAVADGSLVLHYQPEVDLRTGTIRALEALVRWQHPTRGLLPPGAFLQVAEATNLAGELGRWVIRTACAQLAQWRRCGLASNVVLRINVSPVQLVALDFVENIEDVLRRHGIEGSSICLEITEHVVVQDLDRTCATLNGLKELGVQIAIDDFGTGYSSLSQLKALPVDVVKIDRSFVQRLGADPDDLPFVEFIVGLAHSLGLQVVGEGVETTAAARTLVGLGCFRAQGFLIAQPMPAEAVEPHLMAGRIPLDLKLPEISQVPSAIRRGE